jgi:hypothetical protein
VALARSVGYTHYRRFSRRRPSEAKITQP